MLKYAALSSTNAQTTAAGCCAVPQNPWQGPKSSCKAVSQAHLFLLITNAFPPTCVNLKDLGALVCLSI